MARSDGQSKFMDIITVPAAVPTWRRALESVDTASTHFFYAEVIPSDLGYVFLEPAMYICAQSDLCRETYFKTWLKY